MSHFEADPPESLLSHFNYFGVSGLPGGHQHHNSERDLSALPSLLGSHAGTHRRKALSQLATVHENVLNVQASERHYALVVITDGPSSGRQNEPL